jgi:hypothetical protein
MKLWKNGLIFWKLISISMKILNVIWIECYSIELNTIFFSSAFNIINVFIKIWIELNLVELNQIQFFIETNLNSI